MKAGTSVGVLKGRFTFIAAVFFAACISIANAGPQPMESKAVAVPEPEPFSWTGFYIGGNIGWTWDTYRIGNFNEEVDVEAQFEELDGPVNGSEQGNKFEPVFEKFAPWCSTDSSFFGGGQVGFNKQFGHFVIGFEGDFDGLDTSVRERVHFDAEQFAFMLVARTHVDATRAASTDWNASARLRAGYACGRLLFYLTGGAAFADLKGTADDTAVTDFFQIKGPPATVVSTNRSSDCRLLTGWTGGLGTDWAITRSVSVGVSYRYSNFGGHTFAWDNHDTPINPGENSVELSSHQVTFRVNILLCNLFGRH